MFHIIVDWYGAKLGLLERIDKFWPFFHLFFNKNEHS